MLKLYEGDAIVKVFSLCDVVAFYSCIVYLFPLLDSRSAPIICCVVSEFMFYRSWLLSY
jgi:hypothetical protein